MTEPQSGNTMPDATEEVLLLFVRHEGARFVITRTPAE